MKSVLLSCLAIVCLAASANAHAQAIVLVCHSDPGVMGRGDCALARGHHGQWVRGSARLAASGRTQGQHAGGRVCARAAVDGL